MINQNQNFYYSSPSRSPSTLHHTKDTTTQKCENQTQKEKIFEDRSEMTIKWWRFVTNACSNTLKTATET